MPQNFILRSGDEFRIVAPSDSWKNEKVVTYKKAAERLIQAGYRVTYGHNVKSQDYLGTASAQLRADDLNNAFRDENVKVIMALHGGFFENEILPLLDWDMIKEHPKPFVGYSDNTVLVNALFAKTGEANYLGPNFGTLGYENGWEYGFTTLLKILKSDRPVQLIHNPEWYENDIRYTAAPWDVVQAGMANAVLLGGNSQSFYLLQGTEYQPDLNTNFILALEADELAGEYTLHEVTRSLESILQLPGAREHISGIFFGRFKSSSKVTDTDLAKIIREKWFGNIPVISNLDFGHTTPIATLPIGGMVKIEAQDNQVTIEFA